MGVIAVSKSHGFHAPIGRPLIQRGNMMVEDTRKMARNAAGIVAQRDADERARVVLRKFGSWNQVPATSGVEYRLRERARAIQAEDELNKLKQAIKEGPDKQFSTLYEEREAMMAEIARLTEIETKLNGELEILRIQVEEARRELKKKTEELQAQAAKPQTSQTQAPSPPSPPTLESLLDFLDRITSRGWKLERMTGFTTFNPVNSADREEAFPSIA